MVLENGNFKENQLKMILLRKTTCGQDILQELEIGMEEKDEPP